MRRILEARSRNRGQVGLEYMMIFGFAILVIVPFVFYFFFYTGGPQQETDANQALLVARRIVDTAEVTYSLGDGARNTVRVYLPSSVTNSNVSNSLVIFQMNVKGGTNNVIYPSQVNISGRLPNSSGVYYIHMETMDNYVNISYS